MLVETLDSLPEPRFALWLVSRVPRLAHDETEGGFMNTGVNGGEVERDQSKLASISVCTSPWHPSFTPSILSRGKKPPFTGVGSRPQLDGGLLVVLPDVDSGGVDGKQ